MYRRGSRSTCAAVESRQGWYKWAWYCTPGYLSYLDTRVHESREKDPRVTRVYTTVWLHFGSTIRVHEGPDWAAGGGLISHRMARLVLISTDSSDAQRAKVMSRVSSYAKYWNMLADQGGEPRKGDMRRRWHLMLVWEKRYI